MTQPESPSGPPHAFWRLKRLREAHRITLEDLALRSGLTKSFLSKVERGVSTPSIGSALKIADAFGVPLGDLFGAPSGEPDVTVVRRHERQPFNRRGQTSGHRYEAISLARSRGLVEVFVDTPPFEVPPGHRPAEHRGEELLYVLKGRIALHLPHEVLRLAVGDCVLFDGHLPHFVTSLPPRPGEILVIVTPGVEQERQVTLSRSAGAAAPRAPRPR